jgi:hypothetical protein
VTEQFGVGFIHIDKVDEIVDTGGCDGGSFAVSKTSYAIGINVATFPSVRMWILPLFSSSMRIFSGRFITKAH